MAEEAEPVPSPPKEFGDILTELKELVQRVEVAIRLPTATNEVISASFAGVVPSPTPTR